MNDRIRQLAEQANVLEIEHYDNESALEMFAELILRECISKYDEWAEHSTDKTSFHMARHNIKKHFGVDK